MIKNRAALDCESASRSRIRREISYIRAFPRNKAAVKTAAFYLLIV